MCTVPALLLIYLFYKKIGLVLWIIFIITWAILGTVWVLSDDTCDNDFPEGYIAAGILVIMDYVLLGLIFIACCIFGISACIGQGLLSDYQEVN